MCARLGSQNNNMLFKIIWQEAVHAIKSPIAIEETPRAIMAVAEDAARQFLISLRDLTLTFGETDRFLDSIDKDCPDKESVVKGLSQALLHSSEWVSESFRRIQVYQQLKRSSILHNDLKTLIDQLQLTKCSAELARLDVVHDTRGRLQDVVENMLKNVQDINNFSEDQRQFLQELSDVAPFLEWLRSRFSDDTDFQNFITIARQAVGEKERELAFLEQASRLVSDCQRLFFNLNAETGLDQFLDSLKSVFRSLDKNFGTKLRDISQKMDFLKSLDEQLLDLEKASIAEASVINKSGIIRVGYEETDDQNKDVDRWIKIVLSDETETKYSPSELRDLNSRLTLIGDQGGGTIEARREMDAFVKLHKGLERLSVACQQHRQAGNVFLSNWSSSFYADCAIRTNYAEAHFGSGSLESALITEKPPIMEEIQILCQILEKALGEWHKHLQHVRHKYPILSQYTNTQMEILRRRLAGTVSGQCRLDSEWRMMLIAINNDVDVNMIAEAIRNFLATQHVEESAENEGNADEGNEKEKFLRELEENQIPRRLAELAAEEVQYGNVDDAIAWALEHQDEMDEVDSSIAPNGPDFGATSAPRSAGASHQEKQQLEIERMRNMDGLLANKVVRLWRDHMGRQEECYKEFISLECLGHILNHLAHMKKQKSDGLLHGQPDHEEPPDLPFKTNEPNLILASEDDVYRYVVTIYQLHTKGRFPDFDQVLVCRPSTTEEEIALFVDRVQYGNEQTIYSIVDVHQLAGEAARQLEISISSINHPFLLIIFGAKENFEKCHAADGLLRYQRVFECPKSWIQSRKFLTGKLASQNWKGEWDTVAPEDMANRFRANLITSVGYGHGKSLCSLRQLDALQKLTSHAYIKVPVHDVQVNLDVIYEILSKNSKSSSDGDAHRFFHLDILNHQTRGVDTLIFQLLVLGGFTTTTGRVWRVLENDKYIIEMSSARNDLLVIEPDTKSPTGLPLRYLLPIVLCHSPKKTFDHSVQESGQLRNRSVVNRYCDVHWLGTEHIQRCCWYLSDAYLKTDDNFVKASHAEGDEKSVLQALLGNCGIKNPSWFELENYAQFLNEQLLACERSNYCNIRLVGDTLPGFRQFIVKFMKFMARDIATRSLEIAEQVATLEEEDLLNNVDAYQTKHRWEHHTHPYVFFNEDANSMSFFGCHLNGNGDLVDGKTSLVYPGGDRMASTRLMLGLRNQEVDLQESFDDIKCPECKKGPSKICCNMCRQEKLTKLCRVMGVAEGTDPDKNYEITADNAMKILGIKMRLKCGIPVILMGETGCGKTRLVQFMSQMESHGKHGLNNLILFRMHGGITKQRIEKTVNEAIELAKKNWKNYELPTYLFFDEANTTPEVHFLKEIICDGSMNGAMIEARENHLCIVAAVNPYRKHDEAMIRQFESSGLGYHVGSSHVQQTFGTIPLRHLVYRVEPLSPSLIPFVIDFGTLTNEVEKTYIQRMLDRFLQDMTEDVSDLNEEESDLIDEEAETRTLELLAGVQAWMKNQEDETSFVSLRNVDRTFKMAEWFLNHSELLLDRMDNESSLDISKFERSMLLGVCVCYRASLLGDKRAEFDQNLIKYLGQNQSDRSVIQDEIDLCESIFLSGIKLAPNVAKNSALRENLFLMTLCIELRLPLFLIGRPGSSKSLAKTILEENVKGEQSPGEVYKELKRAAWYSFQCSPLATTDDIENIFRNGAKYQKDKNLSKEVAVVVADEVGLAEDTLALKSLHGLLEEGAKIGTEKLESYHKVAFIGISNFALDPAKMNRGIFVIRPIPGIEELTETAKVICQVDTAPQLKIARLIDPLVRAYATVYKDRREGKEKLEFFGLRDFYCLLKMIFDLAEQNLSATGAIRPLQFEQIMQATRRNFSGQEDRRNTFVIFEQELGRVLKLKETTPVKPSDLIRENLQGLPSRQRLNRFLLILTENDSALHLIRQMETMENAEIIFGSGFPRDQEYAQVCKNINRIKVCMNSGKTVVLLNLDSLYESLYDLLNQAFIRSGGKSFVDLGLGTQRLKCHVHPDFRLIVVVERHKAIREFPVPLINRLEKHFLTLESELDGDQRLVVHQLNEWVTDFVSSNGQEKLLPANAFIGYTNDTVPALVIDAVHKSNAIGESLSSKDIFKVIRRQLVQCSTPESILRLPLTDLKEDAEQLQHLYFREQPHSNFVEFLEKNIQCPQFGHCLINVTTHSRLLNSDDKIRLSRNEILQNAQIHMLKKLHLYATEAEFLEDLNDCYTTVMNTKSYLIIQCSCREEDTVLVAGCCFHLEKKMSDFPPGHIQPILICSLPRKKGGCYAGFRIGLWECIHIDQLIESNRDDQDVEMIDLLSMQGKTISNLLTDYVKYRNDQSTTISFNFIFLIADCLKLAAARIRDESDRKLERATVLLRLWDGDENFGRILCQRLINLLCEMERRRINPEHWMLKEVDNMGFIFQNSTYAQAVRKIMESDVTTLLAGLISVIDNGSNLNLLENGDPHTRQLWLELFEDDLFVDVHFNDLSALFFEDNDGFVNPRTEFLIDSSLPFTKTPFYSLVTFKIFHVMQTMEAAWSNSTTSEKTSLIAEHLLQSTNWFQKVLTASDQTGNVHNFAQNYYFDVIQQNYPTADPILASLLHRWLEEKAEKSQYRPVLIGVHFSHQELAYRMRSTVELVNLAPDGLVFKQISDMAPEELALLGNQLHFEMDLYVAMCICDFLEKKITKKMDEETLIADQVVKIRGEWLASASKVASLMKQVLISRRDPPPAYQNIMKLWFSIELCLSFFEQVKFSSYLFKVTSIKQFAERNSKEGISQRFWQNLENSLTFINREMEKYYKSQNGTPDAATREALLMFFSDIVFEAYAHHRHANDEFDPNSGKQLLKYIIPDARPNVVPFFKPGACPERLGVFQSFVMLTICCRDLDTVLLHVDEKCQSVQDEILMRFSILCINAMEDSYHASYAKEVEDNPERGIRQLLTYLAHIEQNANFLDHISRNGRITGADLGMAAKIRFVISSFADLVYEKSINGTAEELPLWNELVDGLRRMVLVPNGQTIKYLLIKLLCRHYNRDTLSYCASQHGSLDWIIDEETFKVLQSPDPFVIYGQTYYHVSNALYLTLSQKNHLRFGESMAQAEPIDDILKHLSLVFAMHRLTNLVILERPTFDQLMDVTSVELNMNLRNLLEQLNREVPGDLAGFIWHVAVAAITYLSTSGVAEFFKSLLMTPHSCVETLFPSMDDDLISTFSVVGSETFWRCPNGHPYLVDRCGKPMEMIRCSECGVLIGGERHIPTGQNVKDDAMTADTVKFGHILGSAGSFVQAGQRDMNRSEVLLTRCLMHAAMLASAFLNGCQAISALIKPQIPEAGVVDFLCNHLNHDIETLSRSFDCSTDDVFLLLHQLMRRWVLSNEATTERFELKTKPQRYAWEENFAKSLLRPVIQESQTHIQEGRKAISSGDSNPLCSLILQDKKPIPDDPNRFWYYRPATNFQALTNQTMNALESLAPEMANQFDVLRLFLTDLNQISALRHLLSIRQLHTLLISHFCGCVSIRYAGMTSIENFLKSVPDKAAIFKPLIDDFFTALIATFPPQLKETLIKKCEGNFQRLPLVSVLPLSREAGSYSSMLVRNLVNVQNNIVDAVCRSDSTARKTIGYEFLTSGQVIDFDVQRDGPKLLMLHRSMAYDEVTGSISAQFDLELLQRRIKRFILSCAVNISIPKTVIPLMKAREALMLECLEHLRNSSMNVDENQAGNLANQAGVTLTPTQIQEVIGWLRESLPRSQQLLENLELMIRFSPAAKDPTMHLSTFLRMVKPNATHTILRSYTLHHLVPLWQLTAFMVKWMLVEKNIEDPFSELENSNFKVKLGEDERKILEQSMAGKNVLQFIMELTEFLLLDMQPGCNSAIESRAAYREDELLEEPLSPYIENRPGNTADTALPDEILVKHVVDVWNVAARKYFSRGE